jgi:ribosome-associated heat shock protein Hsp15
MEERIRPLDGDGVAGLDSGMEPADRVRIDKWLWAARFFKTRSLATEAVDGGKVEVNGERAKPAKLIKPGDEVRVRLGPYEHVLMVRELGERRGPASVAQGLYEETEASRAARERLSAQLKMAPAAFVYEEKGRPTKKDRRDLAKFIDRKRR